jgi:predicted nicotinamide N-methyase
MKKKKSKATERRAYGVTILKGSHSRIRGLKLDHEPEIHGDKFWNSSFLIMDYLQHQGLPRKSKVVEVGCGWGLAAIYCAKEHGAEVAGVDADPKVFPYLHLHAEINKVRVATHTSLFQDLKKKHLAGLDLMIGADICFWDEMIDPLYKLIRKAVKAGVGQVIVADPGRPPFDEVCEKATKKLGGEVKEWQIDNDSVKTSGWLLIVGSLPTVGER